MKDHHRNYQAWGKAQVLNKSLTAFQTIQELGHGMWKNVCKGKELKL